MSMNPLALFNKLDIDQSREESPRFGQTRIVSDGLAPPKNDRSKTPILIY